MNIKHTLENLTLLSMSVMLVACGGSKHSVATSSVAASSLASSSIAGASSIKLQAEDYLRFNDTTPGNTSNKFRTDDVDIEDTTDTDGGYNIGYMEATEWLEYDINVTKAGTFKADARVASAQSSGVFAFEIDGVAIGSDFNVATTGGWQVWTTLSQSLGSISAGEHAVCVQIKSSPLNLNWFTLNSADGGMAVVGTAAKGAASTCIHPVLPPPPPVVTVPTKIKLNQVGFKPNSEKLAVIPAVDATAFSIVKAGTSDVVLTGMLTAASTWAPALDSVKLADFSSLTAPGSYQLSVMGVAAPANFVIGNNVYDALNAASVKAFYYNRASTALLELNAGVYNRAAGHMDDKVLVHASAATTARPEGTVISAPKGWYDAGDYNQYIVNSGISTYMLMAAYESLPSYFNSQNLNIPESDDAVPDVLNEVMWNLSWMLDMQDPNDGGVYHKLTSKEFSGLNVMPAADTSTRYVVQKTTAATLDFAAVMAVASRIYAVHEATYPGLSAKMLAASKFAYAWAKANPAVYFKQPSDIKTGEYGDKNVSDEFVWAAAELYVTTKEDAYYTAMNPTDVTANIPSWGDVKSLAWVSLANNIGALTSIADKNLIKSRINGVADSYVAKKSVSAYAVSMTDEDFGWGSNSAAAGQAFMLLTAYKLDPTKAAYLTSAQSLLDYLLGRNATDYSFVTGFGSLSPQKIHHRPSIADTISGSIPGFLVGGPNPGQQDKGGCSVAYPTKIAAKSYLDDSCSYASNEIAINWNAPLVFVTAALQALAP